MQGKVYLGDGVYLDFDGWSYILSTENGLETTNIIYLEPAVVEALLKALNKKDEPPNI